MVDERLQQTQEVESPLEGGIDNRRRLGVEGAGPLAVPRELDHNPHGGNVRVAGSAVIGGIPELATGAGLRVAVDQASDEPATVPALRPMMPLSCGPTLFFAVSPIWWQALQKPNTF